MKQPWDNLPSAFVEKLQKMEGVDVEAILSSCTVRKPSTFRANTLKISSDELQSKLQERGIEAERVSWYKDAFILKNVPQKVLTETDLYQNGYFYVQSLSSMIPPLVLDPKPNERVLDLTAAPGSKTTQMAALMQNTGEIIANDKSRIRMYKLEANLKIQGVTNTKALFLPGEFLWKRFPEYFDKTLVDVPCSMEGRFWTENPKTYQDWTPGKVKMLAEMQKWLLRSAISATVPGGTIVYSTCTLSPEENEGVIDWILKKEGTKLSLEKISLPHLEGTAGLTEFGNKKYDSKLKNTLRIFPTTIMEGFFVAKFKKLASTLPDTK
ncbi:MAG TPA: RsmB/NOP family class I SAM-dependent RNA methyltransferase [Candidatus Saccharimonadales bacterium]|nr:RsmB/NOP family class I SAM-dependent RNA methyltransferase [Candidatus Saccharimonadales bacterium]